MPHVVRRHYKLMPAGVVTGLAWTKMGGALLYIESINNATGKPDFTIRVLESPLPAPLSLCVCADGALETAQSECQHAAASRRAAPRALGRMTKARRPRRPYPLCISCIYTDRTEPRANSET